MQRQRIALPLLLAAMLSIAASSTANAARVVIINNDSSGEGFNNVTEVEPVGGNFGATLGEQRLIAAQHAADLWGEALDSSVTIRIAMSFDPLFCDGNSATIGQAGSNCVHANFDGAPHTDTLYPSALANKLFGADLCRPGGSCICPTDDITARFNSAIGTTCSFPADFYLGLDGQADEDDFDLVTIMLHEFAHGLGFLTFVDITSGERFADMDDHYMRHLEDTDRGLTWSEMSFDVERKVSAVNNFDLHWSGDNVTESSDVIRLGRDEASGQLFMYAPETVNPGSSISHFDISVFPNQLMEPFYTEALHDLGLTARLMEDIGWGKVDEGGGDNASAALCGDANQDRRITAGDALTVLRRAVLIDVFCPGFQCDVDDSGVITATDALNILREAIELPPGLGCGEADEIGLRLESGVVFGSLQLEILYNAADGDFQGNGDAVSCETGTTITEEHQSAFNNQAGARRLLVGIISEDGVSGPSSIGICQFNGAERVSRADFQVRVVEARTVNGEALSGVSVFAFPN